jgi:ABC-2 type transport system permease protein
MEADVMSSVRRTMADLRLFGRGYLRNIVGLFFGIIFPVIIIGLFGAIFAGSGGAVTVYVQNKDTGPFNPSVTDIATPFIDALNGTDVNGTLLNGSTSWPITVQLVDSSVNFSRYLADHSASDGVIIPENFSLNYLTGQPLNITVYGNPAQSSSAIVSGVVDAVVNGFNLQRVHGTNVIQVSSATVNTEQTKYIDFLVPGLIGFSILVSPMFSMVNIASEYKKVKLFKQLSLTPLHKMEWLASKVIFYIILSVISFLFLVVVGVYGFGAHMTLTPWLIPFLILGPMLFSSLGMLVGTVTKSVESASVLGNIITFPMMFLSGTFFPIATMPMYLQNFAHVLPLFYIVEGLNNVMVYGNIMAALFDIAITTVITLIVFVAAAKLFKWRED